MTSCKCTKEIAISSSKFFLNGINQQRLQILISCYGQKWFMVLLKLLSSIKLKSITSIMHALERILIPVFFITQHIVNLGTSSEFSLPGRRCLERAGRRIWASEVQDKKSSARQGIQRERLFTLILLSLKAQRRVLCKPSTIEAIERPFRMGTQGQEALYSFCICNLMSRLLQKLF